MRKLLPVAVTGRRRWRRSSGSVFVCEVCGKGDASGQDVRAWNSGPQETREKKTRPRNSTLLPLTSICIQKLELAMEFSPSRFLPNARNALGTSLSLYLSLIVCPELLGVYQALHYAFCWLHQSCMLHRRISLHTHAAKVHKKQQSLGYMTFLCDLITQRERKIVLVNIRIDVGNKK